MQKAGNFAYTKRLVAVFVPGRRGATLSGYGCRVVRRDGGPGAPVVHCPEPGQRCPPPAAVFTLSVTALAEIQQEASYI